MATLGRGLALVAAADANGEEILNSQGKGRTIGIQYLEVVDGLDGSLEAAEELSCVHVTRVGFEGLDGTEALPRMLLEAHQLAVVCIHGGYDSGRGGSGQ